MRNGLVILPFSQKTLKFITSRLRNSLRRNAQKAGQSLKPGAASAPGQDAKNKKSLSGAAEERSRIRFRFIGSQLRSNRDQSDRLA